jgi:hypothetical protein
MWDALRAAFLRVPGATAADGAADGGGGAGADGATPDQGLPEGTPYRREIYRLLGDLQAYHAFQARLRRPARLRPALGGDPALGDYVLTRLDPPPGAPPAENGGGNTVLLLNSRVRLNTGGTSLPVLRMLSQILDEAGPKLVLSVGFGGGVTADDRAGDVIVTSKARYRLRGELRGYAGNGQTFGGRWAPEATWFDALNFEPLAEPALIAPTVHHAEAPAPPPALAPLLAIDRRPVLTAPLLYDHGFALGAPTVGSANYLGRDGCAADMDAAPVAQACDEHPQKPPCGFVVGILLPLLATLEEDHDSALRKAWMYHFATTFAERVAQNAAGVVHAICRQPLDAGPVQTPLPLPPSGVEYTGQWLW